MDPVSAETQTTYDQIAADYAARSAAPFPELLADLDALSAAVPAGGIVADVGCGPGRDTALLRARGLRVVGLDLSIGQLRTGGQPGVVQADMRRLPLADRSVAGIWSYAALLHIPRPDVPAVLGQFGRVARPAASFVLALAEGDGEGFEPVPGGGPQRRWFTYHREPELRAQLTAAGFQVTDVRRRRSNRHWLILRGRRAT